MNKKKLTVKEIFALALQSHKENKLENAESFYKKILKINSKHFDSIYLLGTLFLQTKKFDEAKKKFKKAIQIQPNHAALCNNYGATLIELG